MARLTITRCDNCGQFMNDRPTVYYPEEYCPSCLSGKIAVGVEST